MQALADAALDAVARTIADVRREAERAEQLRAAEHRAFMAEQRETLAEMRRAIEEKLAAVKDGKDGERGERGDPGEPGERGETGERGLDGKDGIDGKDGEPGRDGVDGKDGLDGASVTDVGLKIEGDVAVFSLMLGDTEHQFEIQMPYAGAAKGLFDPDAEYRARDVVQLNGSAWMAKVDAPGECPGDGWMLLAGRGKRGDRGERGERGVEGKAGKDGAQPVAHKLDADTMQFETVLDNGEVLEADFVPIAQAIIQAVRE